MCIRHGPQVWPQSGADKKLYIDPYDSIIPQKRSLQGHGLLMFGE